MQYQLVLTLFALISAVTVTATSPKFCNGLNCPHFKTLYSNQTANLEVRQYEAAAWVSVNTSAPSESDYGMIVQDSFQMLFDYISGHNQQNEKVPMAAPVSVKVFPGAGPACNSTFIVSFFVPFAFQASPATPSNPRLYINRIPAQKLAVRQFGGYTNQWKTVLPEIQALYASMQALNIKPQQDNVETICGYDSPFKIIGRHNEIWAQV